MIHRKNILWLWLWLLLVASVGCRQRVELQDPERLLEPIDLILRIGGEPSDVSPQDPFLMAEAQKEEIVDQNSAMGITVTRKIVRKAAAANSAAGANSYTTANSAAAATRAAPVDELIKDLNIFLFHKERDTIVRHYYFKNPNPSQAIDLHLNDLYVGNYYFYAIANNGRPLCDGTDGHTAHLDHFGCTIKHHDMSTLKSSAISVNSSLYYNLMTYSTEFQVKRNEDRFSFTLNRLTSKIDVTFVNNWNKTRPGATEYVTLDNYSIMNLPIRTTLFSQSKPSLSDLDNRINVGFPPSVNTKPGTSQFVMLNNMQGDVAATSVPSHKDRYMSVAPVNATYLSLMATYIIGFSDKKSLSYHLYLGGPGDLYNNYDVQNGLNYSYQVTFNKPDFNDPRVTSMSVLQEDSPFTNGMSENTFSVGTVISRPLEIQCSRLEDDELMLSCENVFVAAPSNYKYSIYALYDSGHPLNGEVLVAEGSGDAVKMVKLPVTSRDPSSKMATVKLRITYVQNEASSQYLSLTLRTKQGQLYQIKPYGSDGATQQLVTYNP